METFSALLSICVGNNSSHKGQGRGALMFSLICVWINGWENNREAGDLIRHRDHYEVNVMLCVLIPANAQGLTGELVLPQGCQHYAFSLSLPPELPPSFEEMHGCVRYCITATISTRWGNFDHCTTRPFTVISPLDLNSIPESRVCCPQH